MKSGAMLVSEQLLAYPSLDPKTVNDDIDLETR